MWIRKRGHRKKNLCHWGLGFFSPSSSFLSACASFGSFPDMEDLILANKSIIFPRLSYHLLQLASCCLPVAELEATQVRG
uniref:Uncharacterized protein n=1 Tax=Physcomitrium patens TaxID=3218 RepID=A0A2K1L497_PHYPA|nr:hypothetical protein PHYPA_003643 [Physcomitrium patens]